jgi:hypothetical protein
MSRLSALRKTVTPLWRPPPIPRVKSVPVRQLLVARLKQVDRPRLVISSQRFDRCFLSKIAGQEPSVDVSGSPSLWNLLLDFLRVHGLVNFLAEPVDDFSVESRCLRQLFFCPIIFVRSHWHARSIYCSVKVYQNRNQFTHFQGVLAS